MKHPVTNPTPNRTHTSTSPAAYQAAAVCMNTLESITENLALQDRIMFLEILFQHVLSERHDAKLQSLKERIAEKETLKAQLFA